MARTHGKDTNFSFGGVSIEDELNTVTMTADVPEADATAFVDAWQVPIAGKPTVSLEIQGTVDPAASQGVNTLFDAIGGGVVSTVFDLTGSGPDTNDPEYQCSASGLTGSLVSSLRINFAVGDAARYQATIQNSGLTSRAVA